MKILDLQQGSPEWKATRARHFAASDAPIMMSASSKASRYELLRMTATGDEKEYSQWVEDVLFSRGHEIEAQARPIAERIIGEELYPATATDDDGCLLASFDGITMLEDRIWECKQWNEAKAAAVRDDRCPEEDYWQVVQQLAISGAERCLYMVTDGTEENTLHCWIEPDPDDIDRLYAGWRQFEQDLAEYQPRQAVQSIEGRAPDALPALHIEVQGMVTASNLAEFKHHALSVIEGINTSLQTDSDFADADKTTKWLKDVEGKLDNAKGYALSQTADIDQLFRTIDSIREEARAKRLELEKRVKARKQAIREEILFEAKQALAEHIEQINNTLEGAQLPAIPADFAGTMKGKKTVTSLRDAADAELARAKIEANQTAERIRANLKTLEEFGGRHRHLFHDAQQLVLKEPDDLVELVKARVIAHEAEEAKRQEAERERIRQEEQARLQAEQSPAKGVSPQGPETASQATTTMITDLQQDGKGNWLGRKQQRPTDDDIIAVLALHYRVHEHKVIDWLLDMDLRAASDRLASNF